MMKKFLAVIFVLAAAAQAASPDPATINVPELRPAMQQPRAAHLAAEVLTRYHYKAVPLDDAMSEKIFDRYLKALDGEKVLFTQEDIDGLAGIKRNFDDSILREDLTVPFSLFNLYTRRVTERYAYARSLLKGGFDFREQEIFHYERTKEPWAKSEAEIREIWRKRVKNDWLRLKLTGKEDKDIVETLDKRYENNLKRVTRMNGNDAFQTFMNAYTMAIEPHTNYMEPRTAAEFDISMKLSLMGIGAVLTEKDDYTTIRELVPGGPAALSGKLKVGDRILGVAQGEAGAMTDIQGWRMDDAVALIRGEADSVVVLDILPGDAGPDGKHKRVSIVRKKVALEEQSAKKSILSFTDGPVTRRIGVITLPAFYEDFDGRKRGDSDFKSASRDVARLLEALKKENVEAILVDLRNNGGGSLSEAIDLTGLFTGKGPVVQQRDARGAVTVGSNTSTEAAWSGPLGVIINRASASASEIFAAAIQDYGRGVIIGERSFGKGTVQTVIDLDQIARNEKPKFGELKITVAQFFRVDGGTTQLRGVTPDIGFPESVGADEFGESGYDNALPWMKIKAANYAPKGDVRALLPQLQTRHVERLKTDKGFQCLQEDIAEFKRKRYQVSLNEMERRKERDARETRQALCEAARSTPGSATRKSSEKGGNLRDDGLQSDERKLSDELAAESASKKARDVFLEEAARIVGDEADLLKSGAAVTGAKPGGKIVGLPG